MANTRLGNPNVFASLPFDQIDGVAGGFLHDDFLTAATVADYTTGSAQISELNWWGDEIGGNDAAANGLVIPGEADHAGILQLQSGGTTPGIGDGGSLQLGGTTSAVQDTLVLDDNGVYIASVIRFPDVDDQKVEFGLIGQEPAVPNASVVDAVVFAFDPADTTNVGDEFFFAQVNAASTDTEVISALPYVQNDWVLLEIGASNTSAHYRITTEDATETSTLTNTMPIVGLRPVFSTTNITTTEELIDIDLFHMRYLRRDAILGQGSDWLGA